jgi:MSHA biogenesis protein MshO
MITHPHRHCHSVVKGFTLIELIIAISISVIVVGFMAMFITVPVDNYMAQSRRAELSVESDIIQRMMENDIHNAVPNSIRRVRIGAVEILEMLNAVDMAGYREQGTTSPVSANDELTFTVPDIRFTTIGRFNRSTAGSFLIVNQSQTIAGQDAYKGDRSITPLGRINSITNSAGKATVRLTSAFQFASPSPNHRVFLVDTPIAYVCDESAHTLRRYANYAIASGIAANRNSATLIGTLSQDINTCSFPFSTDPASPPSRPDLVTINIQLQRAGETQFIFSQSSVEYLP